MMKRGYASHLHQKKLVMPKVLMKLLHPTQQIKIHC